MAIAVPCEFSHKRMIDGIGRQDLIGLEEIKDSI